MNATTTTPPASPEEWFDVLPLRGGARIALKWLPHATDYEHGEGFAILTGARNRTAYAVSEAPETHGRCFLFTKVGGRGTDKDRESYLIRCDRDGTHGRCECRGFVRLGYCRHSDAVETLIMNRWL